ncbi:unnamed protein product [Nezara viridula]|uniref:Uncharacterized protein n=1 Tax=Nezara viridula TaxID=85310 RepID=A0A9P0H6S6_NEZVI|nr:unnamed protein product [Nezara viridula]
MYASASKGEDSISGDQRKHSLPLYFQEPANFYGIVEKKPTPSNATCQLPPADLPTRRRPTGDMDELHGSRRYWTQKTWKTLERIHMHYTDTTGAYCPPPLRDSPLPTLFTNS